MDIHNYIMDIHNWIVDIQNRFMDIHNYIMNIYNYNIIRQCLDSEPHHWNWANDYVYMYINGYDTYPQP